MKSPGEEWMKGEPARVALRAKIAANTRSGPNGCVDWTGAKNAGGYGVVAAFGRTMGAHRAVMLLDYGAAFLRRDQFVCHKCNRPSCVNREHLYVGNAKSNARDQFANPKPPRHSVGRKWLAHRREAEKLGMGPREFLRIQNARARLQENPLCSACGEELGAAFCALPGGRITHPRCSAAECGLRNGPLLAVEVARSA